MEGSLRPESMMLLNLLQAASSSAKPISACRSTHVLTNSANTFLPPKYFFLRQQRFPDTTFSHNIAIIAKGEPTQGTLCSQEFRSKFTFLIYILSNRRKSLKIPHYGRQSIRCLARRRRGTCSEDLGYCPASIPLPTAQEGMCSLIAV